jgi:cyclic pyranopterin phosphate synthase
LIEIREDKISSEEILKVIDSVRKPEAGAVVLFLGTVRFEPGLESLELESYKEMAEKKLNQVRLKAMDNYSIFEISIVHRTGKIGIGENIIVIAVSAPHRTDAFSACEFLINDLKVTAPIWKKEVRPSEADKWVAGEVPKEGVLKNNVQSKIEQNRLSGMVDVSAKEIISRHSVAEGFIDLSSKSIEAIKSGQVKKGDVLEIAKIAAITGVKQTPNLIPLCHQIPITAIDVNFKIMDDGIKVSSMVKADYKTGVEMDALMGVNIALLTIWDMVKYIEKDADGQYPTTNIKDIRVIKKEKG